MINQTLAGIILAIIQSITEFLPISSDGHLALFSNLIGSPNLAFIILLHFASLFAVIIYTRKEIWRLLHFKKEDRKYLVYLIIGIIPAGLAGFFLKSVFESQFNSLLFTGIAFIFTGGILLMTKDSKQKSKINLYNSIAIGFAQILALFPGISRSATTISTAKIMGVRNEDAFKFSFLLLIPLTFGAVLLDLNQISTFSYMVLIPFFVCFVLSLFCLKLLEKILKADKFWMFSFYCFFIGIVTIILYFIR
jgi:undecaprenyl-diphosphatase